jgi:hypothetical protein
MVTSRFSTRRPFRERARRLLRHPIQTIRESQINRRERIWNFFYTAARESNMSETNARKYADEISGRTMRSRITDDMKSFLKPRVKLIRARQDIKEKIVLLIDKNNQLAALSRTPHLPKRKRAEINAKQDEVERQMDRLYVKLLRVEGQIENITEGK